jgi:fibronectin-binding autotransporter adhesin
MLAVSGTMTNTGTLTAYASRATFGHDSTNHGGTVDITGVLTKSGTILVDGYGFGHSKGGTLSVTGLLANTDVVMVQPGGLLTMASAGTLTNAGTLTVDGGDVDGGAFFKFSGTPPEATFSVAGAVTNTGSLYLTGGIPGLDGTYSGSQYAAVGAQMTVSATFTNTAT